VQRIPPGVEGRQLLCLHGGDGGGDSGGGDGEEDGDGG